MKSDRGIALDHFAPKRAGAFFPNLTRRPAPGFLRLAYNSLSVSDAARATIRPRVNQYGFSDSSSAYHPHGSTWVRLQCSWIAITGEATAVGAIACSCSVTASRCGAADRRRVLTGFVIAPVERQNNAGCTMPCHCHDACVTVGRQFVTENRRATRCEPFDQLL